MDLIPGDAARLGVRDRRCISARARSKELLGCLGDRGVATAELCASGRLVVEKDIDCSDVGVDSSMAGGVP